MVLTLDSNFCICTMIFDVNGLDRFLQFKFSAQFVILFVRFSIFLQELSIFRWSSKSGTKFCVLHFFDASINSSSIRSVRLFRYLIILTDQFLHMLSNFSKKLWYCSRIFSKFPSFLANEGIVVFVLAVVVEVVVIGWGVDVLSTDSSTGQQYLKICCII